MLAINLFYSFHFILRGAASTSANRITPYCHFKGILHSIKQCICTYCTLSCIYKYVWSVCAVCFSLCILPYSDKMAPKSRSYQTSAMPITMFAQLIFVAVIVLLLVWLLHFREGLSFTSDNKQKLFNVILVFYK